jgi:Flp pilus assembly protein CpaB
MEAHRHFGKSASGALGSRRTAILVAGASALAAAALIYLFVTHYRKAAPVVVPQDITVLVAKQYIPAGTPQSELAAGGLLKPVHVPPSQVVAGALSDPAVVAGQATSVAVEAGQQITAADFSKSAATSSLTYYLKGDERGVGFTLDAQHGLTSYLQPGNTVDVMDVNSKSGSVKLLIKDVTVIANSGGIVVLRLTDKQALLVASGTTVNDSLWLTARPTVKGTNSIPAGEVGSVGQF